MHATRRTVPELFALTLGFLALAGVAVACGGPEAVEPLPPEETAGAEELPPPVPTGPPESYIADEHTVVLRVDLARVRESGLSNDIGSLIRSYPMWRDLLGTSGLDPIRDFDRVLVAAPAVVTGRSVLLIQHHLSDARIREAVLAMAVDRGARPTWRQVEGFDVVDWPADTDPPRLVVVAGPHELVVTTQEDLAMVLAVARDHALRRSADEIIEPALTLDDGVVATIVAAQMGDAIRSRLQHPPESFQLTVRDDLETPGRMLLAARGGYADTAAAEAARTYFVGQRDFYAGQMLVRAVGLDRPLREAVLTAEGPELTLDANFTEEEVQRVLGLLALGQLGGS